MGHKGRGKYGGRKEIFTVFSCWKGYKEQNDCKSTNFMFDTAKCPTNVSTNNWCGEQSLELNLREALQAATGLLLDLFAEGWINWAVIDAIKVLILPISGENRETTARAHVTFIQRGMRTPRGFLGEGGGKTYRCGKEKMETGNGSGRNGMPSFRLRGQVRTMIKTEFFRQPSEKSPHVSREGRDVCKRPTWDRARARTCSHIS